MSRNRIPFVALALSTVFVSSAAFGQVEQRGSTGERARDTSVEITNADGASYDAIFQDDLLTSLVNGGEIPQIKVRGVKTSGYLIRPRTHFVPELLKSVELI